MKVKPYLVFNGQAEEAANFYAQILGAKLENLYRYSSMPADSGMPEIPADYADKIMHCCVVRDGESIFSLADTLPTDVRSFGDRGHILTIYCDSVVQAEDFYAKLSSDAKKIECPMCEPFYAKRYAEVVDKFGVFWALIYEEN